MAEVHDLPFQPVTASALWARFPRLAQTAVEGVWQTQCPVDREHGIFEVREGEDGWRIGLCLDGCLPREIWAHANRPQPVPEAEGWGFTTATEFLAKTFPVQRWLYLDLVPAESVTVIMAAPNAGKTFFGLDVVCQVAAKVAASGKLVTIVEEEGTGAALQWRLRRALAAVGLDGSSLIRVAWNTGRSLRNPEHLASLARECMGSELIMLDSLSALAGGIDENSSEDMAAVAEALHQLKTATGAAVVPLHHMTKAAWKEGETPRLEHMRGHGALPGRADAVIALVPLESDEEEVRFEVHCVKQRDGSKPKARSFAVAMKGPAATVTLSEKDGAWVKPAATGAPAAIPKVLAAICAATGPVSKNYLCNILPGRDGDIRKAVDLLFASSRIVKIGPGQYLPVPSGGGAAGAAGPLPEAGAAGAAPLKGGGSTPGMPHGRQHGQRPRAGSPDEEEP